MCIEKSITDILVELIYRENDDVKAEAIAALGDYKATTEQHAAISRLLEPCQNPNKIVAICSIKALSKLSQHF